ncbi:15936_t:CDS:1, partial [Gigaspora margarita]
KKQYNLRQDIEEAWFGNMAKSVKENKWLKVLESIKHISDPGALEIVYLLIKNVKKVTKQLFMNFASNCIKESTMSKK